MPFRMLEYIVRIYEKITAQKEKVWKIANENSHARVLCFLQRKRRFSFRNRDNIIRCIHEFELRIIRRFLI